MGASNFQSDPGHPLGGVAVSLWLGAAPVKATSTADGAFKLSTPASAVTPATFTAWASGFAPRITSLRVGERTELQTSNVNGVLDGDLDPFIEAYLLEQMQKRAKAS